MLALFLLASCEPENDDSGAGHCSLDEPQVLLVRSLRFSLGADGVSEGFDLDGLTTAEGSPDGCGIADYVSPTGAPGIDNSFTRIAPTLNATEAKIEALEGLVQSAIDSGELLITFELGGVDDWEADDCVDVRAGQAIGTPAKGTDGLILDGQTFDRDADAPSSVLEAGTISGGVLEARGLSIDLPVQILNASLTLPMRNGAIHVVREGDDLYSGYFSGGVSAAYMLSIAQTENVDPTVADLLGTVLTLNADLPTDDAECGAVSITLAFEAVGAWFYEE